MGLTGQYVIADYMRSRSSKKSLDSDGEADSTRLGVRLPGLCTDDPDDV